MKWILGGLAVYVAVAYIKGHDVGAACFPAATGIAINADQTKANCDAANARWSWFPDPSRFGGI